MKPKEFTVQNIDDFRTLVDAKHFSISEAIVDSILKNLKTRKKRVHVLSVKCVDDNTIFDITLDKTGFVDTLRENLKYFEERELYEECAQINKAIDDLSKVKKTR